MSQPVSLRLDDKLHAVLRSEAGRRRIPFADFVRVCIERGLWIDGVHESGLRQSHLAALYESRNLLRRLVSARSPKDAAEAQAEALAQAKEELP